MVVWACLETAANKCISFPGSNKWEWRKSVGTCRPETENSCCRPAGNNSSNVEHKLCIEFLWKLQQLPLDFLHPFSWKLAGVSGSGYIITGASSRRVNMLRVQLDTGTGWVAGCLQTLEPGACPSLPTAHCWHDPSFGRLCWWVWIVNMFVCGPNNGNNNDNYLD